MFLVRSFKASARRLFVRGPFFLAFTSVCSDRWYQIWKKPKNLTSALKRSRRQLTFSFSRVKVIIIARWPRVQLLWERGALSRILSAADVERFRKLLERDMYCSVSRANDDYFNRFHMQKKRCASCSYPSPSMRRYNWSMKALRRRTTGSGRTRFLKNVQRRFKNGFREGTVATKKSSAAQ